MFMLMIKDGAPQGERFIIALLNDIKNLKNSNK